MTYSTTNTKREISSFFLKKFHIDFLIHQCLYLVQFPNL